MRDNRAIKANRKAEKELKTYLESNGLLDGIDPNLTYKQARHIALKKIYPGFTTSRTFMRCIGFHLILNGDLKTFSFSATRKDEIFKKYRQLYGAPVIPQWKSHKTQVKTYIPNSKIDFYKSREWRALRVKVLIKQGRKCCVCGSTPNDGIILHVDHIKPRSKYPELELVESNLQILCEDCNLGKSNNYEEDWRL